MNLKTKFLLKKIASILCLLVAGMLFFTSWISVRTNEFTKELKTQLRELDDELEMLEEECEEMQDELEEVAEELDIEVTFSIEDSYESMEMLYKTVQDLALSPKEIISFLPLMNKLSKLIEEFEESELPYYLMPTAGMDDFVEMMTEVKGVFIGLMLLLVVTIALEVMYILFHIMNKKGAGFAIIPFQAIWFIIVNGFVLLINVVAQEELGAKVIKTTPAVYISLVLVIASCIIWRYAMKDMTILQAQGESAQSAVDVSALKDKAANMKDKVSGLSDKVSALGEKMTGAMNNTPSTASAETVTCPQCGKACEKGALFCMGCGTKLQQTEQMVFCMNCGQKISANAMFCNYCGTKVE
ncbi:MAG: zinc-ribbon domain-containing protein [Lachnospiraceae bacterium]|nr:zinc-ribbon domain-containing protein [Lachnospiraceae bacterium]